MGSQNGMTVNRTYAGGGIINCDFDMENDNKCLFQIKVKVCILHKLNNTHTYIHINKSQLKVQLKQTGRRVKVNFDKELNYLEADASEMETEPVRLGEVTRFCVLNFLRKTGSDVSLVSYPKGR